MMWRTHALVGANAVWLSALAGKVDNSMLVLLPLAAIAALLPDIDASAAKIHYMGHGVLGLFRGVFRGKYFHHRGLMHSLLVTVIFFIILLLIFNNSKFSLLPYVFAASYLSHSILDGLNTGVGYLYPFSLRRYTLVPRFLCTKVGGPVDVLLMFAGAIGLLAFLFLYSGQLLSQNSTSFGL